MGDPSTGLGVNRNRFGRNHPGLGFLQSFGLGFWLRFGLWNCSLGDKFLGGRRGRGNAAQATGEMRCSRAGLIYRIIRLLGSDVGNVQGALAIGKFFDANGVGNVGK
jgi:hypothetical protein